MVWVGWADVCGVSLFHNHLHSQETQFHGVQGWLHQHTYKLVLEWGTQRRYREGITQMRKINTALTFKNDPVRVDAWAL